MEIIFHNRITIGGTYDAAQARQESRTAKPRFRLNPRLTDPTLVLS